jgi:hypothetical protein
MPFIGGFAVQVLGGSRTTRDIDIKVDVDECSKDDNTNEPRILGSHDQGCPRLPGSGSGPRYGPEAKAPPVSPPRSLMECQVMN